MLDWPWNFPYEGDMDLFTASQWINNIAVVDLRPDFDHPSSASFYPLTNAPFSVAVAGLYGFTSLVVLSTKGVWMTLFWETPSFEDDVSPAAEQQLRFQQQVIDILGPGDGTPGFPGLTQFMGAEGVFSADTHVQVVIITPRERFNPVPGVMMFADKAQQIARRITQLFGGDWDAGNNGDLSGPVIFYDYTPRLDWFAPPFFASGKALFQYDPVQARCINLWTEEPAQFAQERLWFEDRPTPVLDYYWPVWPEQEVPLPDQ